MNVLKSDKCPKNTQFMHRGSTEGLGLEQQNKVEQGGCHRGGGT